MAEPLAVCLHAVARAGDVRGKRAVLFGAGPIGLLTMLAAQRAGIAETTVVDIAAAPLAFATRLGASQVVDISGGEEALKAEAAARPFDVAFEVSGTAAGLASAGIGAGTLVVPLLVAWAIAAWQWRDAMRVQAALARVQADARSGANLMPAIMEAVKAYASVGEITGVLVGVFGRFREPVRF